MILDDKLMRVQKAMEDELASITLEDVKQDIENFIGWREFCRKNEFLPYKHWNSKIIGVTIDITTEQINEGTGMNQNERRSYLIQELLKEDIRYQKAYICGRESQDNNSL